MTTKKHVWSLGPLSFLSHWLVWLWFDPNELSILNVNYTFCEYAKMWRKIISPYFFASANLAKEIFIFTNIIGDILGVAIKVMGKTLINNKL